MGSERVANALVSLINDLAGDARFVTIEGASHELASALTSFWTPLLPPLRIASGGVGDFGEYSLNDESGTHIRNISKAGLCLVVCEGVLIPDWQSVSKFKSVSPSDLLNSVSGVDNLLQGCQSLDGAAVLRSVRQGILNADPIDRPTVYDVAAYADAVVAGENALSALPLLRVFHDPVSISDFDMDRFVSGLRLASVSRLLRANDLSRIRRAATTIFLSDGSQRSADRVVTLLDRADSAIYTYLSFEEARQIIEGQSPDLVSATLTGLSAYREILRRRGKDFEDVVPWQEFANAAKSLSVATERVDAARLLLDFDAAEDYQVFDLKIRRKLMALLHVKVPGVKSESAAAGLVDAISRLRTPLQKIALVGPDSIDYADQGRSNAQRVISRAAFLTLTMQLLKSCELQGTSIDALLNMSPLSTLSCIEDQSAIEVLDNALPLRGMLPSVTLRVYGAESGDSVEYTWRPSLDDVALLRCALMFESEAGISIRSDGACDLESFVGSTKNTVVNGSGTSAIWLATTLQRFATSILNVGFAIERLRPMLHEIYLHLEELRAANDEKSNSLFLRLGIIFGNESGRLAVGPLSPLKIEWRLSHQKACDRLLAEVLGALRRSSATDGESDWEDVLERCSRTACALAPLTSSGYPGFVTTDLYGAYRFPISESATYSVFSDRAGFVADDFAEIAFSRALSRLITLRPEVAPHLRIAAFGSAAATIAVRQLVSLIGNSDRQMIQRCELLCIGGVPTNDALEHAQESLTGDQRIRLNLRAFESASEARSALGDQSDEPFAHLAVVTGIAEVGADLPHQNVEWELTTSSEEEVLFSPRWIPRPERQGRLIVPPRVSPLYGSFLQLVTATNSGGWLPPMFASVPELSRGTAQLVQQLVDAHSSGMWVATIDRLATREIVLGAVGRDVAILHQETRLSASMPMGLIISQRSGDETDSAILRSLSAAKIVPEQRLVEVSRKLRERAAQIYGSLALKAATTGTGVNELVAHVAGYSILATKMSPWPVPAGCRLLLINLDQHSDWFGNSKRADLIVLALDPNGGSAHVAVIEVKARRSNDGIAASQAFDQLRQTLRAMDYVVAAENATVHGQLWLSRIYEAAVDFVIDSGIRLSKPETFGLEAFRLGNGLLDLGALGLVFGPHAADERHFNVEILGDRLPVIMATIPLTEELLEAAVGISVNNIRTVAEDRPVLASSRLRRRPERPGVGASGTNESMSKPTGIDATSLEHSPEIEARALENRSASPSGEFNTAGWSESGEAATAFFPQEPELATDREIVIGNDALTGDEVYWKVSGAGALPNGHIEVWGASGGGKTQFIKSFLMQIYRYKSGINFGILDFKDDYSGTFPEMVHAPYFDMWINGAPFNPLALESATERDIETAVIELRDMVAEATKPFVNMGYKQQEKLAAALRSVFQIAGAGGSTTWPTLSDLDALISDDLRGLVGDLTANNLFRAGPPLGDIIHQDVIFGLSTIPGNGLTTVLAGGFILSALFQKIQTLPTVANAVRYAVVVDEAHRVSSFKAVKQMIREGRSKGLALILATQQPTDMPEEVGANAQTRVCFRLSDATMSKSAAKRLSPSDRTLPDRIRTLGTGEAFVTFGGSEPRLVRMKQYYRDFES